MMIVRPDDPRALFKWGTALLEWGMAARTKEQSEQLLRAALAKLESAERLRREYGDASVPL